jgi:hypothetical protein
MYLFQKFIKCIFIEPIMLSLNNCLPSKLIAPNIQKCLCDPVTVTTGLAFSSIHIFLTSESKKKNDSSSDTAINPLGKLSSIFSALF